MQSPSHYYSHPSSTRHFTLVRTSTIHHHPLHNTLLLFATAIYPNANVLHASTLTSFALKALHPMTWLLHSTHWRHKLQYSSIEFTYCNDQFSTNMTNMIFLSYISIILGGTPSPLLFSQLASVASSIKAPLINLKILITLTPLYKAFHLMPSNISLNKWKLEKQQALIFITIRLAGSPTHICKVHLSIYRHYTIFLFHLLTEVIRQWLNIPSLRRPL